MAAHDRSGHQRESEPLIWVFEAKGGGGPRAAEASVPLRSNSGGALRRAALDGLGSAPLPAWTVGATFPSGALSPACRGTAPNPAGDQAAAYVVHARGFGTGDGGLIRAGWTRAPAPLQ